jgi:hypothetical protein
MTCRVAGFHEISNHFLQIPVGWLWNKEANWPTSPTGYSLAARDRVLKIACELFAEAGFHGTHLRGICERADTNPTFATGSGF